MARSAPGHPGTRSAPPGTIVEYVTTQIRQRIVLGRLGPGERVPLYALAEEFGISRVPLREAMRQLEAEGLVDNVARRGAIVRPLTEQDLEDCFRLLEHIEVIAAKRAAKSADSTMVATMRYWADRMQALGDRNVGAEYLEAHHGFHFALFDALGDGVLLRTLGILWHTCQRFVMHCWPDPARQDESHAQHVELIDLVEQGDAKGAAALLQRHIRGGLESSLAYLRAERSA